MAKAFPFTAIVGQDEMKTALLVAAVDPSIGGVLVFGDRGTGKSTAIRALAALMPKIPMVDGCPFNCDPAARRGPVRALRRRRRRARPACADPVVDLPLGATEDRVIGALDLERALHDGEKAFEPGLLARAHRGFLYIDEVNLLEDHIVDSLLDVAASGENVVEREGLSVRHPARFVLVGSGNPEEGELRPQLLDRFGLSVEVKTPQDVRRGSRSCASAMPSSAIPTPSSRSSSARRGGPPAAAESARNPSMRSSVPDGAARGRRAAVPGAGHGRPARRAHPVRTARAQAALAGREEATLADLRSPGAVGAAPPPAPRSAGRVRLDGAHRQGARGALD
jgi:magnesium chelatase subunit I